MNFSKIARAGLSLCIACASSYAVWGQSVSQSSWLGVWNGKLDGQPGMTLTLADDTGQLGGTVVFNMIIRQGSTAHVAESDAHVLMHPRLEGDTLSFQVLRASDAKLLQIEAKFVDSEKLELRCLNCGDGPTAELMKNRP
jgi:hypothetical protein